jgi:hypothetical protein
MKVRVLRKHIEEGKPQSATSCPIALALREATGCKKVEVSGFNDITVGGVSFETSRSADAFIREFDAQRPVKPFTLDFKFYNPKF